MALSSSCLIRCASFEEAVLPITDLQGLVKELVEQSCVAARPDTAKHTTQYPLSRNIWAADGTFHRGLLLLS